MTGSDWQHLADFAAERSEAGLRRKLRPRELDHHLLDLASNDYLSLSHDPRVIAAAAEALARWGAGATASRLVSGSTRLHADLESALSRHLGAPAALVFSSGYTANIGAITALSDADTLIVSDAHNHASIIDATRLSRAEVRVVPHKSLAAVQEALATRTQPRALVVTESVFSVDGDAADLVALYAICQSAGAVLVVDEAHSVGVVGPLGEGSVSAAGLAGAPGIVITLTLSKSLAAQGGAVVAESVVIDHLVDNARTFIFDTALAPASAAASMAVLRILAREPELPTRLRDVGHDLHRTALAAGWRSPAPQGAVLSLIVGDPDAAVAAQANWRKAGIDVGVFRPPSVPDGLSRLRLTVKAGLRPHDLALVKTQLEFGPPTAMPGSDPRAHPDRELVLGVSRRNAQVPTS
jgi:8-amino-7-oxononanoate synthase